MVERVWWGWSDGIGISLYHLDAQRQHPRPHKAPHRACNYTTTPSLLKLNYKQSNNKKNSTSTEHKRPACDSRRTSALEPEVPDLLPHGQGAVRSALGLHLLAEVELAAPGVDIDGAEVDAEFEGAAVDLVADEEEDDDGAGEVALEEAFGIEIGTADGLGRG